MKIILIPALLLSFMIMAFNTNAINEESNYVKLNVLQTNPLKGATHKVDTKKSELTWKGFKPTGEHFGSLKIKEGAVISDKNGLKQGSFVIDMTSIIVLDIPAENDSNGKLVGHLKSADFFDTAVYSTAVFNFNQVETKGNQKYLKGTLTLKGITKPMSIPVSINDIKGVITLKAEPFVIDRTDFNIQYKSNKFFDNLKDKFINDEFEVGFFVTLTK